MSAAVGGVAEGFQKGMQARQQYELQRQSEAQQHQRALQQMEAERAWREVQAGLSGRAETRAREAAERDAAEAGRKQGEYRELHSPYSPEEQAARWSAIFGTEPMPPGFATLHRHAFDDVGAQRVKKMQMDAYANAAGARANRDNRYQPPPQNTQGGQVAKILQEYQAALQRITIAANPKLSIGERPPDPKVFEKERRTARVIAMRKLVAAGLYEDEARQMLDNPGVAMGDGAMGGVPGGGGYSQDAAMQWLNSEDNE